MTEPEAIVEDLDHGGSGGNPRQVVVIKPAYDGVYGELLKPNLLHCDLHCIDQHGVLRHRYNGT